MTWTGKEFGPDARYQIADELATGPFGATYRAHDQARSRPVILRLFSAEKVEETPVLKARLSAEVERQSQVADLNLALYETVVEDSGVLAVSRAFLEAPSLDQVLAEHDAGLPAEQALALIDQILAVLELAHDHGLTHLALGPGQVFLFGEASEWTPCLTDFGLPRILGYRPFLESHAKRAFLAPELETDSPLPDHRSDIYSAGCLLAAALTGDLTDPKDIRVLKEGGNHLTPDLVAVIQRAMAHQPGRRFPGARAFRLALREDVENSPLAELGDADEDIILSSREIDILSTSEVAAMGSAEHPEVEPPRDHTVVMPRFAAAHLIDDDEVTQPNATVPRPAAPIPGPDLPSVDSWATVGAQLAGSESTAPTAADQPARPDLEEPRHDQITQNKELVGEGAAALAVPPSPSLYTDEDDEETAVTPAPSTSEAPASPHLQPGPQPAPAASAPLSQPTPQPVAQPPLRTPTPAVPFPVASAGRPSMLSVALAVVALVIGLAIGYALGRSGQAAQEIPAADESESLSLAPTTDRGPPDEAANEAPTELATEAPAPAPTAAERESPPTPLQEPDRGGARGPLIFGDSLWQVGNTWIYRYRREVPPDSPDFLNLEYFFRRRITEVQPHPWGARVVLTDDGGISAPRRHELIASASCLFDADDEETILCLPPRPADLQPQVVGDTEVGAFTTEIEAGTTVFAPTVAWVASSETDRDGQRFQTQLEAFRVGSRSAGNPSQQPPTCDWLDTFERGSRIGDADRPRSPELEQAQAWDLHDDVRRFDVPLTGAHGFARFTAWRDDGSTIYHVSQVPLDVGAVPLDPDDVGRIPLPLDEIKRWLAPDGSVEYLALISGTDGQARVDLLAVSASQVESVTLMPVLEAAGLSVVLLASPQGCYVQVRNGRREERHFANYDLTARAVIRSAGDLPTGN